MKSLAEFVDIVSRHVHEDGIQPTAISGLSLIRSSCTTIPMPVVYEPTLCLMAQGRKQVVLGDTAYVYDPSKFLIASVDLPVMGSVITASPETPYLSIMLDLDMTVLGDLALRYPAAVDAYTPPSPGISLNDTSTALVEAATRLVSLLDQPQDIDAIAPLVTREILYRLLMGGGNHILRQMARSNSRLNQIARAIAWLRTHYAQACRIDDLADIAGMSRSAFHAHFKAITAMSPLEFRSQLRMQEARRLMVTEALDAADAGYRVGYESPSQFSRHYARMFGLPPARDATRIREGTQVAIA